MISAGRQVSVVESTCPTSPTPCLRATPLLRPFAVSILTMGWESSREIEPEGIRIFITSFILYRQFEPEILTYSSSSHYSKEIRIDAGSGHLPGRRISKPRRFRGPEGDISLNFPANFAEKINRPRGDVVRRNPLEGPKGECDDNESVQMEKRFFWRDQGIGRSA